MVAVYRHRTYVTEAVDRQFDQIAGGEPGGCVGHTNDQDDGEILFSR